MAHSSFLQNKPCLLIRDVDAGNALVAFDPWSVLLVSKWLPFGLICSVRRQHLALFDGHCDSSLNRQSQRHYLLIHCADWVHCVAVVNSYFIVTSLVRVCATDCSALTSSFVLLLRLCMLVFGD